MGDPWPIAIGLLVASAQSTGGIPPVDWEQRLGAQIPLDARFSNELGSEIALGDLFAERPVVLALVYYECPMLCNLVLEGLVRGLRAVEFDAGEDFEVVAISINPRETSGLARAKRARCVEAYGRGERGWHFLTGDEAAICAVADAVGFRYSYLPETGEYAHAAGLAILTPEGEFARALFGSDFAPRDLEFALMESAAGKIGSPVHQILLRCFQYDPARGVYTLAVLRAIRLAGTLTVVVLACALGRMFFRERRSAAPT